MIIGTLKETKYQDKRVAITPDTVKKYKSLGFEIMVETSAGIESGFNDDDYIKNGALVLKNKNDIYKQADIIATVWAPCESDYKKFKAGQYIIANFENKANCEALAQTGVTAFALEKMPRISRAQNVDILSSQSNLAGYKAALTAMNMLNRAVPMMITSAGTIKPVKAFVVGLGVAGLQAMATLKRMGAIVYASDTRAETKEETVSLGGRFVETDKQIETLRNVDILITSVAPQGKPAPLLFTKKDLEQMPSNSVIVDLSCANVEQKGLRTDIKLVQNMFFASEVANSASSLFAQNVFNFIKENGGADFKLKLDDQIIKSIYLCENFKPRKEQQ
ncbi:MAG: hypothetical protein E7016_01420 [Alphaproteobacteria bacterium]|nr:hypothetical protein [Alphaproteobacteria bacterium]